MNGRLISEVLAEQLAIENERMRAHWDHPWVRRGSLVRCIAWDCVTDYKRATGVDWGPPMFAVEGGTE